MPQVSNYAAAWVEDTFSKKCLKRVSRYVNLWELPVTWQVANHFSEVCPLEWWGIGYVAEEPRQILRRYQSNMVKPCHFLPRTTVSHTLTFFWARRTSIELAFNLDFFLFLFTQEGYQSWIMSISTFMRNNGVACSSSWFILRLRLFESTMESLIAGLRPNCACLPSWAFAQIFLVFALWQNAWGSCLILEHLPQLVVWTGGVEESLEEPLEQAEICWLHPEINRCSMRFWRSHLHSAVVSLFANNKVSI